MLKLLVVDDSELILSRLLDWFKGVDGLDQIDRAGTLVDALDCVQRIHPTLMILDLHLPDGNALKILPTLRLIEPGMQIAMLSNDASAFNRGKCIQAGANWFFDKSTEFEKVLELVRNHAALHSMPRGMPPN